MISKRQWLRFWGRELPLPKGQPRILRSTNLPLVDPHLKLMVLWSPKSACTTVYTWFAGITGRLEDVLAHSTWPHDHRTAVYEVSPETKAAIARNLSTYRIVRVFRDPYSRFLSSFRHSLIYGLNAAGSIDWAHGRLHRVRGYSLSDFLTYMEHVGVVSCDPHFRQQWHPIEEHLDPDTVINVSRRNLFKELNRVERRLGLKATDFSSISWLHSLEASRRPARIASTGADDQTLLTIRNAKGDDPWPDEASLLTPKARERIAQLYARDFEAYRRWL